MARGTEGYIVDTNVLVSKRLRLLEGLAAEGARLYVTPVTLLEYMNWAVEQRNRALARGERSRAEGYERLVALLPGLLDALGIEVLAMDIDSRDLEEAARLVRERAVDPGDALNAVVAKKHRLGVVTGDHDWRRLRDYAVEVLEPPP